MNRYIAFLKVFERNSFSDAARDLGYTQSAVSQMIKSLEEELGVTLLVRSRSGVALTFSCYSLFYIHCQIFQQLAFLLFIGQFL